MRELFGRQPPQLIVGLGNPGSEHAKDRHNVGFWLADDLASLLGTSFRSESKLLGDACQGQLAHSPVRILKPTTYMNRSGGAVRRAIGDLPLTDDINCNWT